MIIVPKQQTKQENYKLLIGSILPRPIAFVTSLGPGGVVNAAPFSFFNIVGTEPPLISVSCIRKPGGVMKDTARNIVEHGEFVVHVVDGQNVAMVNETSIDFPPEISEAEACGFTPVPSDVVEVPRLLETKIQMECRLHRHLLLGGTEAQPNADLIIGEVVRFHIDDAVYFDGKIDTAALDPVSRLAGTSYAKLGETFSMPRLPYEEWLRQKEEK